MLELNFKNFGLRYLNARKGIRMFEWSIRMQKKAFEYTGSKIWVTEAEGILMHGGNIRMPEIQFECSGKHLNTERGCARRVSGFLKVYPNTVYAIRILRDSIRMPETPSTRTTTETYKKSQNKWFKSRFNALKTTEGALISV